MIWCMVWYMVWYGWYDMVCYGDWYVCIYLCMHDIVWYGINGLAMIWYNMQGFQFRPANGEFRQTFSFNPTQIRQSFYV